MLKKKGQKREKFPNAPKISNYDDLGSANCEFINYDRGISLYSDDVFLLSGESKVSLLKRKNYAILFF